MTQAQIGIVVSTAADVAKLALQWLCCRAGSLSK